MKAPNQANAWSWDFPGTVRASPLLALHSWNPHLATIQRLPRTMARPEHGRGDKADNQLCNNPPVSENSRVHGAAREVLEGAGI